MAVNNYTKYDEDFKKSLVSLHQNGKTQAQLCKEYGVSNPPLPNALNNSPPLKSMMEKFLPPGT